MTQEPEYIEHAKNLLSVCLIKLSQSVQATDPGDPEAIKSISHTVEKVGDLLLAKQVLSEEDFNANPPNP